MQTEANVKELGEIRYIARPFDEAVKEIGKSRVISAEDLAQARISEGKGHSLSRNGSYVS